LVIQTAFTGDVVLATALFEKLRQYFPDAPIDVLVRKGNQQLLDAHPFINKVLIWDKKQGKLKNLLGMVATVRKARYTHVINPHRFFSSGLITVLSGAGYTAGFDKNPLSALFRRRVAHIIGSKTDTAFTHEVDRNQLLIAPFTDAVPAMPRLYPSTLHYEAVRQYQARPYICIAPASVWFTKQYPKEKWAQLIAALPSSHTIFLIGGPGDAALCSEIAHLASPRDVTILCGSLSYLESAALMEGAIMNYTNDSAPLHFASATNSPVTAVFCSTIPQFGFGPLHDKGIVAEIEETLACRPCGLHGHKACPEGHFKCAQDIKTEQLLWWTSKTT